MSLHLHCGSLKMVVSQMSEGLTAAPMLQAPSAGMLPFSQNCHPPKSAVPQTHSAQLQ